MTDRAARPCRATSPGHATSHGHATSPGRATGRGGTVRPGWATGFGAAWGFELLKLRRSVVARAITPLLVGLVPLASLGAVGLARSPELPGAAAVKFAPYATGDVATTHLLVAGQILSVAMLLAGGFAAAWSYGREFTDGTAGALTGLASPRWTIGLVKAGVLVAWLTACLAASLVVTVTLSLLQGGRFGADAWRQLAVAGLAGLLSVALLLPFAWVATVTRSPLGTVAALIGVVAVTQVVVVLGAGAWFPYAVPSLLTGMGGSEAAAEIGGGSILVVAAFGVLGLFAAVWQWQRLDDV